MNVAFSIVCLATALCFCVSGLFSFIGHNQHDGFLAIIAAGVWLRIFQEAEPRP